MLNEHYSQKAFSATRKYRNFGCQLRKFISSITHPNADEKLNTTFFQKNLEAKIPECHNVQVNHN